MYLLIEISCKYIWIHILQAKFDQGKGDFLFIMTSVFTVKPHSHQTGYYKCATFKGSNFLQQLSFVVINRAHCETYSWVVCCVASVFDWT